MRCGAARTPDRRLSAGVAGATHLASPAEGTAMIQNDLARQLLATAAAIAMASTVACAATAPPAAPAAPPAPAPITSYTFDPPIHRNPVTIAWHDATRTFYVGTFNDGTIYYGQLDNPQARVFIEGRRGQTAAGVAVADGRMYVAGGVYLEIRVHDLETRRLVGTFTTAPDGFLLDVTATAAGHVWVTATARRFRCCGTLTPNSSRPAAGRRPGCR